ncbi:MAG: 1L-myo-inositol 1-phosphate cytidylyltransferase / CDP-L-myo-inositol myo-inositolphosphotransferase [Acidobacteriota bacterium]|nr:1L-myo-inositol 1-phosphate cytidylyltransferase / CDP-L-myo-inositol myo-inositolphosphotransferase [Acidobacteriota bacterium]
MEKAAVDFIFKYGIFYKMDQENLKENSDKFEYEKSLKKPTNLFINKINFIDIYLNRPLASLLVHAVFNTRVTPNGLTYFSFFLGLLGVFFFSRGEFLYLILGGVCAQLSSIIDGADGMLARAKNMCSDYGANLDLFLDRITDFSLLVGISLGANIYFKNPRLLILGLLTAGLYMLQINLFYLTKSYLQKKDRGETGEARAIVLFFMLIFAIAARPDIFIYLALAVTVTINACRVFYFISLRKKI